jgi:hypothetical protein
MILCARGAALRQAMIAACQPLHPPMDCAEAAACAARERSDERRRDAVQELRSHNAITGHDVS